MQPSCDLPSEQHLRARLDSVSVFNLIADKRFFDTLESHLPAHRERTYPPTDTLAMFVAQVFNDDSSWQRAVNDRIDHCLLHGLRPPGTSTAAYCEARARFTHTAGRNALQNGWPAVQPERYDSSSSNYGLRTD